MKDLFSLHISWCILSLLTIDKHDQPLKHDWFPQHTVPRAFSISSTETTKPDSVYTSPDGSIIEKKAHLRDLGVEMSSDLTFNLHIENTVAAANKLIGWALRSFRRRSKVIMMTIWKCLAQSKLVPKWPDQYLQAGECCQTLHSPGGWHGWPWLLGEAFLSPPLLSGEEKGKIPDYLYVESGPRVGSGLQYFLLIRPEKEKACPPCPL